MGGVDDLVAWLREQLDDDERVAQRVLRFSRESYAHSGFEAWVAERKVNNVEPPYYDYWQVRTERPGTMERSIVRLDVDLAGMDSEHIARFASPRRVLRDIRGKREMLDDIVAVPRFRRDSMLRLLALPYSDRPGYREEWRP